MRKLFAPVAMLLFATVQPASAQYYGQQQPQPYVQPQPYGQPQPQSGGDQSILYEMKKNQPPAGMVFEQGNAPPGIPTSGVQQQQQLTPRASQRGGPTMIYQDKKSKGLTVIQGPNGTTICRDISGRTVMCY